MVETRDGTIQPALTEGTDGGGGGGGKDVPRNLSVGHPTSKEKGEKGVEVPNEEVSKLNNSVDSQEIPLDDNPPQDSGDRVKAAVQVGVEELSPDMDPAVRAVLMKDRRMVTGDEDGALPLVMAPEAEGDLHEKLEWVDRDVQALRELVEAEPGLKSRLDKPFLLSFLRARKFDYDKAMTMIRGYYRARQENGEMYVGLMPSVLDHVWNLRMQTVLPTPDKLGRTVLIFRTGAWLPEVCTLDDVFRSQVIMLEHVVRVPITQLRGITAVVDCSGLSMTHAYYLTPTHIRRMISVIQEVFPLRFKALHFVHEPTIFDWVFSLVKPFLSDTIKGRLHFHGEELESLHQFIPVEELPSELGGTQGPMDNTEFVKNLKGQEDYFKDHFTYGFEITEEPARPGTMMEAVTDMGSLIGSYYRRMCID